ncbi:porin [soil metagenome]
MLLAIFWAGSTLAQIAPDTSLQPPALTLSGFVDVYFSYDFNRPPDHERPAFLYNHNRHNEFNANLALLRVGYEQAGVRGAVALMAGTYAQYNLAHEQPLLQHVFEAWAGLRLAPQLWLDAGIFPSHIGFESAISLENWTFTRSLLAENSPYYLAGALLTYAPNERWTLAGLVINGWQNIRETSENSNKAIGTQVSFSPREEITFNWSTFTGQEQPDWAPQWRYFQNFYGQMQLTERWGLIAGLDYGWQQAQPRSRRYDRWYSPVVVVRYAVSEKVALAGRAEHYNDRHGVIIEVSTPGGFRTSGASLGLDYHPARNVGLRVEVRGFMARDPLFTRGLAQTQRNVFTTSSLAISF